LRRNIDEVPIFWGGAEAFTDVQKRRLLSPRLRQRFGGLTSWEPLRPIYRRFQEKAWDCSPLNWMTYVDLNLRLPELLLMRVDKMSMGVSLEGRVPFLDHKFVELAMSIPPAVKTRNGTLKHILKKAVRGVIPDELIDRKKQGFGVPIYEWFFDKLGTRARKDLTDFCNQTDFLDSNQVLQLFDEGLGSQTWYLLNFSMWWKEFFV
jgi:asparagine synthase (glutamine-hydrolysing)